MKKFIKAEDLMMDGIIVMFVLMLGMLLFVSVITKPSQSVVEDPCKTNSSINNCYIISTLK